MSEIQFSISSIQLFLSGISIYNSNSYLNFTNNRKILQVLEITVFCKGIPEFKQNSAKTIELPFPV